MPKAASSLISVSSAKEITRESPWARLYSLRAWSGPRGLRLFVLRRDKYRCAACGLTGDHVDHIEPHKGDLLRFLDLFNLQVLCELCHASKTAAECRGEHHQWQADRVGRGL